MKKFKLNVPERKELVTRLVDLTGQRARYTFMRLRGRRLFGGKGW